jgi:hypothetical protein
VDFVSDLRLVRDLDIVRYYTVLRVAKMSRDSTCSPLSDRPTSGTRWALFLLFLYFSFPKVAVFPIGLRLQDFILIFGWLLLLIKYINKKKIPLPKAIFVFILYFFFTGTIAYLFTSNNYNFLVPVRLLEYFGVIGLALSIRREPSFVKLIFYLWAFQVTASFLQVFGLLGSISDNYGYLDDVSHQIHGVTGGPWELACFIVLLSAYLGSHGSYSPRKKIIVYLLTGVVVIYTGSRSGFAAYALLIIWSLRHTNIFRSLAVGVVTTILLVPSFFLLGSEFKFSELPVYKRSENIFAISEARDYFLTGLELSPNNPSEFNAYELKIDSEGVDISLSQRLTKWFVAINSVKQNWLFISFGLGPGTWGKSLDGGWLRLITEMGIVGLVIFLIVMANFSKVTGSRIFFGLVAINMVFIDIYINSTVVPLLVLFFYYFRNVKTPPGCNLVNRSRPKMSV